MGGVDCYGNACFTTRCMQAPWTARERVSPHLHAGKKGDGRQRAERRTHGVCTPHPCFMDGVSAADDEGFPAGRDYDKGRNPIVKKFCFYARRCHRFAFRWQIRDANLDAPRETRLSVRTLSAFAFFRPSPRHAAENGCILRLRGIVAGAGTWSPSSPSRAKSSFRRPRSLPRAILIVHGMRNRPGSRSLRRSCRIRPHRPLLHREAWPRSRFAR